MHDLQANFIWTGRFWRAAGLTWMQNIENNWLEQSHRKRLPSLPICETPAACNVLKASNPPRCSLLLASHLPVALFTFCLAPYSCHIVRRLPYLALLFFQTGRLSQRIHLYPPWKGLHSPITDKRSEPGASRIVSVQPTHLYPSVPNFPRTLVSIIIYKARISRAGNKYSLHQFY